MPTALRTFAAGDRGTETGRTFTLVAALMKDGVFDGPAVPKR